MSPGAPISKRHAGVSVLGCAIAMVAVGGCAQAGGMNGAGTRAVSEGFDNVRVSARSTLLPTDSFRCRVCLGVANHSEALGQKSSLPRDLQRPLNIFRSPLPKAPDCFWVRKKHVVFKRTPEGRASPGMRGWLKKIGASQAYVGFRIWFHLPRCHFGTTFFEPQPCLTIESRKNKRKPGRHH